MTLPIDTEEVVRRWANGETLDEMAADLACHRNTLWYRLKKAGVPLKRVKRKDHTETLLTLLGPLRASLEAVRRRHSDCVSDPSKRDAYLQKVALLNRQIEAVEDICNVR